MRTLTESKRERQDTVSNPGRRHFLKTLGLGAGIGVVTAALGVRLEVESPVGTTLRTLSLGQVTLTIGPRAARAAGVVDYITDGVDDNVQFQAALDALPVGGGKLLALASSYSFSATVSRSIDNVTIQGVGRASFIANDGVTDLFSAGSQSNWVFRDLRVDAGGIDYASAVDFSMYNVTIGSTLWLTYPHEIVTTGIHGVGAGTIVGTTLTQELTNKTLDAAVAKGVWTASGTWTLPAFTLGGPVTLGQAFEGGVNVNFVINVNSTFGRGILMTNIADGTTGVVLHTQHLGGDPAAEDILFQIFVGGEDFNNVTRGYAKINFKAESVAPANSGKLEIVLADGGGDNVALTLSAAGVLWIDSDFTPAGNIKMADGKAINTLAVDDDYYTLGAVDNDTQSIVACLRLVGAVEPHALLTRAKWSISPHAADVGHRGFMYFTEGAGGVADKLYVVMKGADNNYTAVQVAIG